jgi:carbonic anhydrase
MDKKERLDKITPETALQKLIDGNLRFLKSEHINRDFMEEVQASSGEQYPFAIILGCIDSRVPVEILFDQGVGDLFVTRVAGNFENDDILASMEYACKVVGSKLILVLGHEDCGAIKAACDSVDLGYISNLTNKIKPAIIETKITGSLTSKNIKCINDIAKTNVRLTIQRIKEKSTILRTLEEEGKLKIVGAYYNLKLGEVSLLD